MDPSDVKAMRKDLLLKAKLAQEDKFYEKMYNIMTQVIQLTDADLSSEELTLLGAALRNCLRLRQKTWRSGISFAQSPHYKPGGFTETCLRRVGREISQACKEILNLINIRLLPSSESKESKVLYLTLKGDFNWYLAEVKGSVDGKEDADMAFNSYNEAQMLKLELGDHNLHCLALNFSLAEYSYRYLNMPEEAIKYVDLALSQASSVPKQSAPTSLLSFDGSSGLIADLEHLKKKIEKSKNKARPSNVWSATLTEALHF